MRATTQSTLFCECRHALSYIEGGDIVSCQQRACAHYGKRFAAPSFELVEIVETAEPAEPVVAS